MIPLGLDAWRMALISVLASTVTAVFIIAAIRHHTGNRWYAVLGALVWGASALMISQSTIVESYALVTMFGVGAYYFSLKKRWVLTALFLGAGGAVHHLILIPLVVILLANKSEFLKWRYIGIMACFLLFYLYIPITNREPYMWHSGEGFGWSFIVDNASTATMLIGGLAIWDVPKRIIDTMGVLGVSLGLALIPIVWWAFRGRTNKWYKEPLVWLFVLPVGYYCTDLAPQTYCYSLPSIAFGAIITGIALQKMEKRHLAYAVAIGAVALLGYNTYAFDIGHKLDPNMEARRFYDEELSKMPDGEILLTQQGWEWAMVYPYNKEEGRNIIPVCAGTLPSVLYQDQLREQGIAFEVNKDDKLVAMSTNIALSIIDMNENVWTTLPTDAANYGAEVVPAKEHREQLINIPKTITDGSMDMVWQWKPSNPYSIITGSIEVKEWTWIVFSNYTVLTFTMMGMIGAVPMWIAWQVLIKKRKWSASKAWHMGKEVEEVDG